jgi:hypothetical protein
MRQHAPTLRSYLVNASLHQEQASTSQLVTALGIWQGNQQLPKEFRRCMQEEWEGRKDHL